MGSVVGILVWGIWVIGKVVDCGGESWRRLKLKFVIEYIFFYVMSI